VSDQAFKSSPVEYDSSKNLKSVLQWVCKCSEQSANQLAW